MDYLPADSRYKSMRYNRVGASGVACRRFHSACGITSATSTSSRTGATSRAAPSISASRTSTWLTTTARRRAPPRKLSAADAQGLPPVPRRDDHLVEGGLSHVAGPVRGVGLAQVPGRELRPVAEAHGPPVRRHLLQPPLRSGHAARGDHGRAGFHRALGPRAVCRHLQLQRRADGARREDPARSRHALPDPSAQLQHVQPLDRRRPHRHARQGTHRLHRVLAAGAGPADQQVSRRHSRGFARGETHLARSGFDHAGQGREGEEAQRDREVAASVAGADGRRLDAARQGRDVVADRRQQGGAR